MTYEEQAEIEFEKSCVIFNSIRIDYLYSAFYDTIVAMQLHRKLSF